VEETNEGKNQKEGRGKIWRDENDEEGRRRKRRKIKRQRKTAEIRERPGGGER
jgi:hypothetical protein